MRKQQASDLVRRLVGSKVAYARQLYELVGRRHKLSRSLRGHAADGVVGVPPDVQSWYFDRTDGCTDRAARPIPGQRRFHCVRIAKDDDGLRDRRFGHLVRFEPLTQPASVVGKNSSGRIRFEKPPMMR